MREPAKPRLEHESLSRCGDGPRPPVLAVKAEERSRNALAHGALPRKKDWLRMRPLIRAEALASVAAKSMYGSTWRWRAAP